MSNFPFGVSLAIAEALGLIEPVLIRSRAIGPFVANVTIEEHHVDTMTITDHPVERNAVISDHAFKNPVMVTLRVGYSNSSPDAEGDENYVNEVYAQFLALQETRELFEILTGKRLYENMLIQRLATTTDETTENSLIMILDCREVIIVDTQVVAFSNSTDQRSPGETGVTQNVGATSVQPPTNFNQQAAVASVPNVPTFNDRFSAVNEIQITPPAAQIGFPFPSSAVVP